MTRCASCRARLPVSGQCPGSSPLLERDGRRYGIAAQIAHALGTDVTEAMVLNYRRRDGLRCYRFGRSVYHAYDEAAPIERDKRCTTRGRPRQLDAALVPAA